MTILVKMILAIVFLWLLVSLFAMTLTLAFDMSIPEIIEWWEKRKKNEFEIMWAYPPYCHIVNDVCPNGGNCEECRKEKDNENIHKI